MALDLVLFFLFFELTLVPGVLPDRRMGLSPAAVTRRSSSSSTRSPARRSYWSGSWRSLSSTESQTGVLTFQLPALDADPFLGHRRRTAVPRLHAAFAVKAPIFPFHTWSPDAYTEAPTAGSVILVGGAWPSSAPTASSASISICSPRRAAPGPGPPDPRASPASSTARVVACAQRDLKRLLAYSSLAQIGFIALGTFAAHHSGAVRAACSRWSTTG